MYTNDFINQFTKEKFILLVLAFKQKARNKKISYEDILFYNLIRGLDPKRGFTPVKNENKIKNGMNPWLKFEQAKLNLNYYLRTNSVFIEDNKNKQRLC